MAGLKLQAVTKSYDGKTPVIKQIDLDVADGEFIVMVGPSGCGKSTLLRMVAGLERTTSGDIYIDTRRVTDLEPGSRHRDGVPELRALSAHERVRQHGLRPQDPRFRQGSYPPAGGGGGAHPELEPLLKRKPRELSGGQRQRVAMGRAIVREPAVFLFDEPLSNLDAAAGADAPGAATTASSSEATNLYVTHDQVEAMTLAQRVIVMNKGVAEQIGTPSEVYQRPASLFVAGFIGSPAMNLLPGTLSADGGQLLLADGMVLPLPAAKPQWAGRQLTLGIRPEHIQRVAQGQGVPLQLQTLELLGPTIWRTASGAATG